MRKLALLIFIAALIVGIFIVKGFSLVGITASIFSTITETGVIKVEKRDVAGFKAVDIGGAFDTEIVVGKDFSVEVEGDEAYLPFVKTKVEGNTLNIGFEGGWKRGWSMRRSVKLRISMPEIENLDVSGASKANVSGIQGENFSLDLSGASTVNVAGEVKDFSVEASGASKIDASNLKAENVKASASGACKIDVFASATIDADASGASKISYAGEPQSVKKDTSGASSVKKK